MKNSSIHNPHDKLFRASLQYPEVAKEFLELYLPSDIKKQLDLSLITYCNTSFIDDDHRNVEEFVNIMHDKLLPSVEEEIMTLAERIEEKGRLAEKMQIAKKLLQEQTDPAFVAKITELSLEKIKELQKKSN